MTVKTKLIEQIDKIENEELMNSISSMITTLNDEGIFELDGSLIEELRNRSNAIKNGDFVEHQDVKNRFSK